MHGMPATASVETTPITGERYTQLKTEGIGPFHNSRVAAVYGELIAYVTWSHVYFRRQKFGVGKIEVMGKIGVWSNDIS